MTIVISLMLVGIISKLIIITSMSGVGFEPIIPVFKREKHFLP
jgi:hypothetical protein